MERALPLVRHLARQPPVHCSEPAGHGPADVIYQGLLPVTLPDGREHAASLVWSNAGDFKQHNLRCST